MGITNQEMARRILTWRPLREDAEELARVYAGDLATANATPTLVNLFTQAADVIRANGLNRAARRLSKQRKPSGGQA